jgi:hypothetical protein
MDKLKALFGTDALTWEQLEEKLKDNKEVKLANLAAGSHISKGKYDDVVSELEIANKTIKGLQETVSKFDGVDLDGLKKSVSDWETKYNTDIEAVKLEGDIYKNVIARKPKDPDVVMALLDRTSIKRDGDKVIGLTEQLDKLAESKVRLFEEEQEIEHNKGGAFVFNTGGNHEPGGNADTFTAALMKGAGLETQK